MRVAHYSDTPRIGGAERYLAHLIIASLERGHEVVLLTPQQDLADWVHAEAPGAQTTVVGNRSYHDGRSKARRAALLASGLVQIAARLRQLRPDVAHVNNGGYPGSDLARVAACASRLCGVPRRLTTVHSMPWDRGHSQPQLQTGVDTAVWWSVEDVLCPAVIVGRELERRRGLPLGRVRHVPYGVDTPGGATGAPALRERLAPEGDLLVGMVSGTADPEKGHRVLAEAVAATQGVRCVLVGPHPGPTFTDLLRELDVHDRVMLEGASSDIGSYYHAIDLLVVPSTAYECLPLVILEAMAAARPVFASRLSGIPEAVADFETGRLFEPGDVGELAGLLSEAVARRSTFAEMGKEGRRRWEREFSVPSMRARAMQIFEEVA